MRLSFNGTAFLAGSGISVPAGLPSGMMFNQQLAETLAFGSRHESRIRRLLVTDDLDVGSRLRFEQVIALLREAADPELKILDIFDGDDNAPAPLHHFLASALRLGAAVFTTNFDSLIERAYYGCSPI